MTKLEAIRERAKQIEETLHESVERTDGEKDRAFLLRLVDEFLKYQGDHSFEDQRRLLYILEQPDA